MHVYKVLRHINIDGYQNKCIGDDAKAAARQSPKCIKKQKKIKYGEKRFFNMADGIITPCNVTAPCNVACGSGIMTVNSPSGSTLQCDT